MSRNTFNTFSGVFSKSTVSSLDAQTVLARQHLSLAELAVIRYEKDSASVSVADTNGLLIPVTSRQIVLGEDPTIAMHVVPKHLLEKAVDEAREQLISLVKEGDSSITQALAVEAQRALAAENTLGAKLLQEAQRRTEEDKKLADELQIESQRAKQSETDLQHSIESSVSQLKSEDANLVYQIKVVEKDLSSRVGLTEQSIEREVSRATGREEELNKLITFLDEREDKSKKDLHKLIDDKDEKFSKRDNELSNKAEEIATDLSAARREYAKLITDEVGRASLAESQLGVRADRETADRIAGDLTIKQEITTNYRRDLAKLIGGAPEMLNTLKELADAIANDSDYAANVLKKLADVQSLFDEKLAAAKFELTQVDKAHDVQIEQCNSKTDKEAERQLVSDLAGEIERAKGAEQTIMSSLFTESRNRDAKDSEIISVFEASDIKIKNSILVLEQLGVIEKATNQAEHANIINNLNDEVARAKSAENTISKRVDEQVKQLSDADYSIQQSISTLKSELSAKDLEIDNAILSESNRARSEEGKLAGDINNERIRSTASDAQLSTRLSAETERALAAEKSVADSVSNETQIRKSEDVRLSDRIVAEQDRASSEEQAIRGLVAKESSALRSQVEDLYVKVRDEASVRQASDASHERLIDLESKQRAAELKLAEQRANKYADIKVAELIGGAPEALDTLKELADAMKTGEGTTGEIIVKQAEAADKIKALQLNKVSRDGDQMSGDLVMLEGASIVGNTIIAKSIRIGSWWRVRPAGENDTKLIFERSKVPDSTNDDYVAQSSITVE